MAKRKMDFYDIPKEEVLETETPAVEEPVEETIEETIVEEEPVNNSKSLPNNNTFDVTVNVDRLNVRSNPNDAVIEIVNFGTVLKAEDVNDKNWYKVTTPSGKVGYAMSEFLNK